jgi:hypothetical protein
MGKIGHFLNFKFNDFFENSKFQIENPKKMKSPYFYTWFKYVTKEEERMFKMFFPFIFL